jgi:hypothetical protein
VVIVTSEQSASATTTEDHTEAVPHSGTGFSIRQTLVALGIAAIVAAVGSAAIYAASDAGSHNMGPGPGVHGPGPGGWGGGRAGPGGPAPAGALHGEFVVPDRDGGYTTEVTQTGVVTAVSNGSLTARSQDGFTQTYVTTPGSPAANSQPAANDTVTIQATLQNGTATATSVTR